jgi:predicted hydrocarbon binding protein
MRLLNKDSACAAGFPCAMSCEAIQHRRMAMSSPVTLMTYQLYFYEINRVKPMYDEMDKKPPFDIRDITICDECHKIPEIIQSLCAPVCSQYTYENTFKPIVKYATSHCIETDVEISADTLVSLSKRIFNASAKELAYEYLNDLKNTLDKWEHAGEKVAEWMSDKMNKVDVEKDKDSKKVSFDLQAVSNLQSMISFFNDAIEKIGTDSLVVNGQKADYVGNICMDVAMIDVTDIVCQEGDSVEIFGKNLPVTQLSDLLDTIPYEVLTGVSNRVKRVYYQD